ncbi:CHAT domain-containing protein [Noviherbaspirillum sedimenti]|uniref:CHAT domain-containing protein n=1 Tax=Noviherbaspirillum sedimenti TaxID=2320865 RepID=UPI0013142FBF|nr:CHAT domain-containing protein [Noviherbaspirillum sedimenti]
MTQRNEDPKEWALNAMVEARKFYTSGKTVEEYVRGKADGDDKSIYAYYLCSGFIEAGDQIRAEQCIGMYKQKTQALANDKTKSMAAAGFSNSLEQLQIQYNQLLLEQGRYKEVVANLMPYVQREATMFSFSGEKNRNFISRAIAAPILARAQRNMGGIEPVVKQALEDYVSFIRLPSRIMNPRGGAVVAAETEFLLGRYEACYQTIPRSAVGLDVGLIKLFSAPLNQLYEGGADAMERVANLYYLRLQALCAYESGKLEEAKQTYLELLQLEDTKYLMGLQRLANYHLGRIDYAKGDKESAIAYWKAAIAALEAERAAIDSEAGRMGYVTSKSEMYALLIDELVARGRDAEAFEYAERAKSRALVDMLGTKLSASGQGKPGAFSQSLQELQMSDAAENFLRPTLTAGASRTANLRQNIVRGNPHLGSLISVASLPAAQVQSQLKAGETVIEYFGEGERLFAFVVTKKAIKALKLDAKPALAHAKNFRKSITDPKSKDYLANGKKLFDAIMAPALSFADKGPLTIIPHGALHYIPFAALHDGRAYLVNNAELRVLPSASVLPFLGKNASPKNSDLLVLGNPDLGDRSLDLPGAEEEAKLLSRLNARSKLLLRKQASETALRKLGPQHREIHFAMHGKFASDNPLSSGLYMSADAENDGLLTVGELYDLQLNVDLVVLSACETALGDASRGDDVVGLNRGFLYAGASSIVSSLWEVDDQATRDLMLGFYQNRTGSGKAAALRRAQLKIIGKYPHPYYWAAFQISGVF